MVFHLSLYISQWNVLCAFQLGDWLTWSVKRKGGWSSFPKKRTLLLFYFLVEKNQTANVQLKTWLETEIAAQKYFVMTHKNNSLVPIASSSLLMTSFHMWTTRTVIRVAFFWEYLHYWQDISQHQIHKLNQEEKNWGKINCCMGKANWGILMCQRDKISSLDIFDISSKRSRSCEALCRRGN